MSDKPGAIRIVRPDDLPGPQEIISRDVTVGALPPTIRPAVAVRLALLRIAAELAPRVTGGVRADDVVERARVMELYVLGPAAGSGEQPSAEPDAERGAPPPADPPAAIAAETAGASEEASETR